MTTNTRKPKRKLKDISFEHEGAHVALTAKSQGGPANGHDYALVLKSKNYSKETIEKMQQVQVTLDLPEFLRRFFDMYYTDSEVLARMMGYKPEDESDPYNEEDYYSQRLASFTVLKALNEAEDKLKALSELTEEQHLAVMLDQAELEKAFEELDKQETKSDTAEETAESENSTNAGVEKSVEPSGSVENQEKKEPMKLSEKKVQEGTTAPEMVEKSALTAIQKAFEEQKEVLDKALEQVRKYEEAEKQAVIKSKTSAIKAVITDEKVAQPLIKAALELAQEDFDAYVASLTEIAKQVKTLEDNSSLFKEQGASGAESEQVQESAVARILKAQLSK